MASSPFAARNADQAPQAGPGPNEARAALEILASMVKSPAAQNALKVVAIDVLGHDNSKGAPAPASEPSMRGTPGSQVQ